MCTDMYIITTGVAAGVFGSLVGMGGAFVMIPAMTGVLKFSQHQAHGTWICGFMYMCVGGSNGVYMWMGMDVYMQPDRSVCSDH